jgi:hypothetical protein
MKKKPKGTGRITAHDALPHDVVVAIAQGAAQGVGAAAGAVATQAAIDGAKKIIAKKKANAEKPNIILTDK